MAADKPKAPKAPKPNKPESMEVDDRDVRTGDSSTATEREAARTGEFDKLEREVGNS